MSQTFQNFKQWLEGASPLLAGYELVIRIGHKEGKYTLVVSFAATNDKSPVLTPQSFSGSLEEIAATLEGLDGGLTQAVTDLADRYQQWSEAFEGKPDAAAPAQAPAKRTRKATAPAAPPQAVSDADFAVILKAVEEGLRTADSVKAEHPDLTLKQLETLRLCTPKPAIKEEPAPAPAPTQAAVDLGDDDLELTEKPDVNKTILTALAAMEEAFKKGDSATVHKQWNEVRELKKQDGLLDTTANEIMRVYKLVTGK